MAEFRQATRPAGKKGEVVLTPWASRLSFPSPRSFTSCLQKGRPLAYEPSGYPWISRRSPGDFRGLSLASVTVHGLKKKTRKNILWLYGISLHVRAVLLKAVKVPGIHLEPKTYIYIYIVIIGAFFHLHRHHLFIIHA